MRCHPSWQRNRPLITWVSTLSLAITLPVTTLADAPPEPPKPTIAKFCSANQRYCARVDDVAQLTVVAPAKASAAPKAWTIPARVSNALVSDHGKVVVVLPVTANLLPLDAKPDDVVLTFYAKGQAPHYVTLKQVHAKPLNLPKTTSHLHWASTYGFERNGNFLLTTSDGVTFHIDAATGRVLNRRYF
jgi:hypothetical protein